MFLLDTATQVNGTSFVVATGLPKLLPLHFVICPWDDNTVRLVDGEVAECRRWQDAMMHVHIAQ